jgi:hypothetical protein
MRTEFRSPVDDEINDVARSLTAAPPSAALRARISARVSAHSRVSHAFRWSVAVAAASAVLTLMMVWPERESTVNAPVTREQVVTAVPPPAIDQPIDRRPAPFVTGRSAAGAGEPGRVRPIEAVVPGEPIAAVDPLMVEPLKDLNPIRPDGIEVSVLAVDAMTVAPLSQQ